MNMFEYIFHFILNREETNFTQSISKLIIGFLKFDLENRIKIQFFQHIISIKHEIFKLLFFKLISYMVNYIHYIFECNIVSTNNVIVFAQGYGMTEAGLLSLSLGFAKKPFKFTPGSCGTVIRNSRMKIVDPKTGASLSRNQTGEICIRGDSVMKG